MHTGLLASLAAFITGLIESLLGHGFAAQLIMVLLEIIAIFAVISLAVIIQVYMERRICGFIQDRLGPNRVGPFGLLQTVADMIKLMSKEDIVPEKANRLLWGMTPMLLFIPAALVYAVFPFDEGAIFADIGIGVFFVMAIMSQGVLMFLIGGYASEDKYSFMGAMRAVAQMLSSEIPIAFSILAVVMVTGSLRMSDIVSAQTNVWFVCVQPLAFIIFIIAMLMETNRTPFDLVEGEAEIIAGPFTEYSGMRWALFFLAEYANLLAAAILTVTLFLGGWQGPFLPGIIWFIIKVLIVIFIFMWIRWTFPRTRIDQMMALSWKVLLPLALFNIMATGIGIYIYKWIY
ncbi:NADH-quinone oxidoreductase subunit NuoH [Pectinatus cerevisiiphilus]|uniref:NADH-quinone oxidoreductase subunit H n=1 Tax=Pectinatus cerevisiiphilus TaxID=86956 RepID=A0A4R3K8V6_9FIRM|nr:NADH-quinone oxidoreductase subunit NuoH [Pectinatus cerevisiiphilus]TCS79370.1 NADH-quinone oxidoreductase subunit H [Pectinatus cerevisiiphilus]